MKAISLWQPWASLIVLGEKTIETRGWPTSYWGPLLIHAAKRHGDEQIDYMLSEPCRSLLRKHGIKPEMRDVASFHADQLPLGCIVGASMMVGCSRVQGERRVQLSRWACGKKSVEWALPPDEPELSLGDYEVGRFGWKLVEIQRFAMPIPYSGKQGFFQVPDELVAVEMGATNVP